MIRLLMKRICWLAALAVISSQAVASDDDRYIGEIVFMPVRSCPSSFTEAGSTLSIHSNMALYSLFGNRYGGDGHRTFRLPVVEAPVAKDEHPLKACVSMIGHYLPEKFRNYAGQK